MTNKRCIPTTLLGMALVLSLALVTAIPAWAQPKGGPRFNLTPEQAAQLFDLRHQFMNDTAGLRKQVCVKRAELRALWQADKPDESAIVAKQKELHALRGQMLEKSVAFRLKLKAIAPQAADCFGPHHRRGPGHGPCPGFGPGGGPGACLGPGSGQGFGPGADLSGTPDMAPDSGVTAWIDLAMGPGCGLALDR